MKQCNALQVAEIGGLPILVSISSVLLFIDDAQRFGAWLPWWTNRFATSLESFWRRSDLKTSVGLSVFFTGSQRSREIPSVREKKETKRTQIKLLLIDGFKVLLVKSGFKFEGIERRFD